MVGVQEVIHLKKIIYKFPFLQYPLLGDEMVLEFFSEPL